MNAYYSYDHLELEGVEGCISYYEVSEEGYYLRSVTNHNGCWTNSYIEIRDQEFFLPEALLEEEDKGFLNEISHEEFLDQWSQSKVPYEEHWAVFKKELGDQVEGEIVCFYPQGVMVDIGSSFYGLADYHQCLSVLSREKMCPGTVAHFKVDGIEEENFLVHLTSLV
ncbi:hypothetical protein [Myroides odoratimimus]|uniref:S1 motif domain-containing protein n=1 Tax=Myroides odoratimimus CIP 101113 TaxID=883154 RepID=A0AAV3F5W5_9FLAO|nr:hypothetical protein [Myroides odoratimimus]EHO14616.1 hypothetical protein HMPREF9715_00501 [Myroides odoratimimus CIP 101113]